LTTEWTDGVILERSKEIKLTEYTFAVYLEQQYLFVYVRSRIETLSAVYDPNDIVEAFSLRGLAGTKDTEFLDRMF
jgi:hypothetical protein